MSDTAEIIPVNIVIEKLEQMKMGVETNTSDPKNKFRAVQYGKAIAAVKTLKNKGNISIEDIKNLKGTGKGIGDKMIEKIIEITESGDLEATKKYINNPDIAAIEELSGVIELGVKGATKLVKDHKIMSVAQLKCEGMDYLNDLQKVGLKYYDDMKTPIPRSEMDKHREYLIERLKKLDPNATLEMQGSYRRGKMSSGDIDILLYNKNNKAIYDKFIEILINENYIIDKLSYGKTKFMGFCKINSGALARRIDIIPTKLKELPFAQLYFTGNGEFNRKLRENVKKEKNVTLNQYNLKYNSGKNNGKIVEKDFKTEEDILNYLGYYYIPPHERQPENLEKYKLKEDDDVYED